jgi:adenine-specific DNA-methyltransferase
VTHNATMQKLTAADPESHSPDLAAENLAALQALFPELITEGPDGVVVNVDVLKALVGDKTVSDADEKYGLNWHGKRRARQLALTPSTGTLRPCPEESVDWDTTQNLMIEGDNLEVLKLLQKSYAGKVKLIYIDPPYNTGKDFVYPDNFQDNIKNYLELTGQTGEGGKRLSTNTEASGRFHTDWLNMMYPRLKLARNLLREDGAIFISCDDGEVDNLRIILDDIFGLENFVAQFVWKARQFTDARATTNVSTDHEYILAYARDAGFALRGVERDESKFTNPDNDPRGPWMSRSMLGLATRDQRPNLHYHIIEPVTGRRFPPNPSTGWRYSSEKMHRLIEERSILFPSKDDGRPREKKFRKDMLAEFIAFRTIIDGVHTADGTEEIRSLFGKEVFSFPKPTELLRQLVEQVTDTGDIVMDFFAGSGTTAHAVWQQNKDPEDLQRWILVQLPEPLDNCNKDQKVAADFCDALNKPRNIAELTKERLRRAAMKIREENPLLAGDLGFRVFKLDSTNILEWDPDRDKIAETLEASIEHLKTDRTEQDILFELLLKLGLDLCVPIETQKMEGNAKQIHDLHSIGGGSLLVCLSKSIPQVDVEPMALALVEWHQELKPAGDTTVVFRDSAFADDVAKTNITAILQQHGLETVRSL